MDFKLTFFTYWFELFLKKSILKKMYEVKVIREFLMKKQ